jgi:hypothetical protein
MGSMFQLLDKLDKVDIRTIIILCLEQSQYEILAFNRGQLYAGQDNQGNLQSPLYAQEQYAIRKEEQNPVPGLYVPDFFVTGDYYNSLQVNVNQSKFEFTIFSEGIDYAAKLERKWSRNYGLDPQNMGYLSQEIIKPKINEQLRAELGL